MHNKRRSIAASCCAVLCAAMMLAPATQAFAAEEPAAPAPAAAPLTLAQTGATLQSLGIDLSDPSTYSSDKIIVTYDAASDANVGAITLESALGASDTSGAKVLGTDASGNNVASVPVPSGVSVQDALQSALNEPNVAAVQPDYIYQMVSDIDPTPVSDASVTAQAQTNDPYTKSSSGNYYQWWLQGADAFNAWDQAKTNQTVTVAMLDTGVRLTHDDLAANIDTAHAWDAVTGSRLTTASGENGDVDGHGTHTSGIVAEQAGNGEMGAGISYNAKILPVNIFYYDRDSNKEISDTETLTTGIQYIRGLKASDPSIKVMNMSIGGYESDNALHQQIIAAENEGILSVAAAGNEADRSDPGNAQYGYGTDPIYPADYNEVISVTAIDQNNQVAYFSNHNQYKDIAAPGVSIVSTWDGSDSDFESASGTSMASPMVAGAAALLFAADPSATPELVKAALYGSAVDLGTPGRDDYYGNGKLDAAAAVKLIKQMESYTGWKQVNGSWYYFNADHTPASGWDQVTGPDGTYGWYYFNASGQMVTGWVQSGSSWYYLAGNGAMVTGWQQLTWSGGYDWFYFTGSGAMYTGWLKQGNTWYFLYDNGNMAKGWAYIYGTWYYFNNSGAMYTGWLAYQGAWYYLSGSGAMVTGQQYINGRWSAFDDSGRWLGYR